MIFRCEIEACFKTTDRTSLIRKAVIKLMLFALWIFNPESLYNLGESLSKAFFFKILDILPVERAEGQRTEH